MTDAKLGKKRKPKGVNTLHNLDFGILKCNSTRLPAVYFQMKMMKELIIRRSKTPD